jgi:hypothetical protein
MRAITIKRCVLLASLAAVAVGASGCTWFEMLTAMHQCSLGNESACNFQPEVASVSAHSKASADAAVLGKGFRLGFRGKLVGEPTVYPEQGGAAAGQSMARGRFNGSLLKDSRLSDRFEHGRWVASTNAYYDPDTRALSGQAFVKVRFADRRAGSVCLYVNVSQARRKNGGLREKGLVVPLGGTGLGARLTGKSTFVSREGRKRARTRGRTSFHLRQKRQKPTSCAGLRVR